MIPSKLHCNVSVTDGLSTYTLVPAPHVTSDTSASWSYANVRPSATV